MKKNVMMRVASALLVAVLMTTCAISGTFAKYTTTASGKDAARVANWGFEGAATLTLENLFLASYDDVEELKKDVLKLDMFDRKEIEDTFSLGGLFDLMYKRKLRPNITQPTILYNFPNLVPLARPSDANPKTIEMFQVLVCGSEIVKAYSELVDPVIQRETLEDQAKAKASGDEEAMDVDEDFLLAMEHGMPPMSGLGMGIDRLLVMLYSQPSIRDVVLFPIMK